MRRLGTGRYVWISIKKGEIMYLKGNVYSESSFEKNIFVSCTYQSTLVHILGNFHYNHLIRREKCYSIVF